jgi:SAM-dependent methyltransferase
MQPEAYQTLVDREETYWWHRARRLMAAALLRRHGLPPRARLVDLGCGIGGNMVALDVLSPRTTVGVDLSPIALGHARARHSQATLVRADLNQPLPFAAASVDAVTIFNVLYHQWVRDEVSTLTDVCRILRPGGVLLATEPAFKSLGRQMDQVVLGGRRYRIPQFSAMCRRAGLDVHYSSYFTSFGVPIILLMNLVSRLRQPSADHRQADLSPIPSVVNRVFYGVAALEAFAIGKGVPMPFGVTLACVARKPAAALRSAA